MNIVDTRTNFIHTTFSKFRRSHVLKELEIAIYHQRKEEAFFWTGELLCSGFILDLWNVYIRILCIYIHIHNPKLSLYVYKKFTEFKTLAEKVAHDLELRNSQEARTLFFSVTLVLCECKKDTILSNMKFAFVFNEIFNNLKAPDMTYVQPFFKPSDPKEFYIPLNELMYNLKDTKKKTDSFYWIEWIIGYDNYLTKQKKPVYCVKREFMSTKILNPIWMVWELFLSFGKDTFLNKIIKSLLELFSIRYTVACNKKRVHILNLCVMLLITDRLDMETKIMENTSIFNHMQDNIDLIFKQLKNGEVREE